ncbi:hypothetical protein HJ526_14095 [Donghicola sp. C2-DW-16]|uniref:Flagellar motor switch protein FliM n=1 Tax=Donghicola mangrovi TaxID=2729614 RepID=A0ABX2PGD3_9RHOB|nr:FliM/FliN family flagellar motor switch protein [Donghicola mangrovi]NVO28557.1 hypothetical protein [Donghicola mangrovi]
MPDTALERMVRTGPKPVEPSDRFARACEVALGDALNHPVVVEESPRIQITAREAVRELSEGAMVLLLDAPDGGTGALLMPADLAAGMIELLTFGMLSRGPVAARMPTATDAAVIEPVVRALLQRMAAWEDGQPMRFGALLAPSHFARVMPEGMLDAYCAKVTLSDERAGHLRVLVPVPIPEEPERDPEVEAKWRASMAENVTGSTVRVEVMLDALHLTLAEVSEWTEGTVLTFPVEVLESADLRVRGGDCIGRARVGRLGAHRAVRLPAAEPAPETELDMPMMPALVPENDNGDDFPIAPV